MGRYSSSTAYGHSIRSFGPGFYEMCWTVDRYYAGCRLRFPTTYRRATDTTGAKRFCKKHGLTMPKE